MPKRNFEFKFIRERKGDCHLGNEEDVKIKFVPRCLVLFFAFLGALVFAMFLMCGVARAADFDIAVNPPKFELELKRGEVFNGKVQVVNYSKMPLPLLARMTSFSADEETGQMNFDETSQDPSFNSKYWFKIENPNLILNPGEARAIKFQISVPENAEPGGHYAVMLFEPQIPALNYEEGKAQVVPIVGVLFLTSVNVEGVSKSENPLVIVEFSIPEKFHLKRVENFLASIGGIFSEALAENKNAFSVVESGNLSFSLRLKNNDIYHIKPEGKLTISGLNRKLVGETKIPKTTILPGKVRKFPVEIKPQLPESWEKKLPASVSYFISHNILWGKYRAQLELKVEGDTIFETIEFWVFPWKIAIVLLAIFLIFLMIRKRLLAAIRVLTGRIKNKE